MLPHQLPQLIFYPYNNLVYFMKKEFEGLRISYGSIGLSGVVAQPLAPVGPDAP